MYKKAFKPLLLSLLCLTSSINCMDLTQIATLAATGIFMGLSSYLVFGPSQTSTQPYGFWIKTSDDHVMYLKPEIINECERLKQHRHLYPNNSKKFPLSKICFTKNEIDIFIDALSKPIDYENNFNTIVRVTEKFGMYLLYAHCVSHWLGNVGAQDIDRKKIIPLLKKLTNNNEPTFLLSPLVALKNLSLSSFVHKEKFDISNALLVDENEDYCLVNADRFTQSYRRIYRDNHKEKYVIFNKNKNEVHRFKAFNVIRYGVTLGLKQPYLLKTKKNLVLFYTYTYQAVNPYPDSPILYDFVNHKIIQSFSGRHVHISADEKYIGNISTKNNLCLYNIEDSNNIKYKEIACPNKTFRNFEISHDSRHLVALVGDAFHKGSIEYWHFADFDWNNENYLPVSTALKADINLIATGYRIKFYKDNKLLIATWRYGNGEAQSIDIIDFENQEPNGNYSTQSAKGNFNVLDTFDLLIEYNNKTCLHKESCFSVYNPKDLSRPIFHYKSNTPLLCATIYANASFLGISPGYSKFVLLHYNTTDNNMTKMADIYSNNTFSINNRGWTVTSQWVPDPYGKISLFDNRGKKVLELPCNKSVFDVDLNGHDLRMFHDTDQMDTESLPAGILSKPTISRLLLKTTLYTQKELEQCNELYDNATSQQYAFFDTMYHDYHQKNSKKLLYLKKDTPLEKVFGSFTPDQKNFITDKLKVIEQ